jgi:tetratricopeptide (TPR) repeat protein
VDLGSFAGREHRRKSREHLNARRWQQALDEAKALPETDAEGWYIRGRARNELRQDKQALADLDRALALSPGDAEAAHYRGHCHESMGQYREAAADFDAALKRSPADAHLLTRRGVNRLRLGEYKSGVADLRKALGSKPERPDEVAASSALARALVCGPETLRDPVAALRLAERAEELARESFSPVNALGVVYYRLGEYEKARDKLTRAAALLKQPPPAENRLVLAMAHHRLGEPDKARACYDQGVAQVTARPAPAGHPREQLNALRAEAQALLDPR